MLGPLALFRSSRTSGRRVLLRGLPPEECLRFQRETADRPARADQWTQAQGIISREFPGNVLRVKNKDLVPADLAGRPEPEIFVLLFASHNDGESWAMLRNFQPTYRRIQQIYPGRCETVFFGVRHDGGQHKRIAVEGNMPWLVTEFSSQPQLGPVARYAPGEGILMLAISRDGVPLTSSRGQDVQAVKKFIDELTDVLRVSDPENPATWRDRLQYLNAVRPAQFPAARAEPVLVANPLRADGLRQYGVTRVAAKLEVGADGKVSAARLAPDAGVPAALAEAVTEALRAGAVFSPAIERGKPAASHFDYVLDVPAQDPRPAADLAWYRGDARTEVPLTSWLVLKPIAVPESAFSSVEHVDDSGVNVLSAYVVGTEKVTKASQMSAFSSDWFGPAGAASVAPVAGAKVVIEEKELVWRAVKSADGYVDLQTFERQDYCIGYAATEIESPAATDGWLGIGSDDGLRIWLNGELVHDRWIRRISQVDDDIVPLKLRAGKNRLLIKIQNATGDWSFIARLRVRQP